MIINMITYHEVRDMMPSVRQYKAQAEEKLAEIETLIQSAARVDKENIEIFLPSRYENFIFIELRECGFEVEKIYGTTEFNGGDSRTKYRISWR